MKKDIEAALARHCAAVLLGKKPAALFARPEAWGGVSCDKLQINGTRFYTFHRTDRRPLILAYQPELLAQTLKKRAVSSALSEMRYPLSGVADMLRELERRVCEGGEFPHEIGFFLGYPPEDVLGFIRHKGRGGKLCGAWKVYHDAEAAARQFAEYAHCKRLLTRHIQNGGTIFTDNLAALLAA